MLLGSLRSFRPPVVLMRGRAWRRHPSAKENLALHDSRKQWFIGYMDLLARVHRVDLLARFIGNMDLLARVHRVDLLARFIGNMDLLASRLISYAFKGQMNDL